MNRTKHSEVAFKRGGGKNGSGMTHVRYGHNHRPTLLEVRCPRCGGRASASKPSESDMGSVVGDLSGTWHLHDWVVSCSSCPLRLVDRGYDELPPLYFVRDGIFAWNLEHLQFIADSLRGFDTSSDPYHFFGAYIKGDWLRHRTKSIKIVEAMLSTVTGPLRETQGEQDGSGQPATRAEFK